MIDYASVAQEILETPLRQPDWVRERIRKSDVWMQELELLNLAESEKAPQQLRNHVAALANDLEVKVPQEAGAWRRTQALLDLVFECQEVLLELGGYRQLRCPNCGAPSGLHISAALEERERYQCQKCQHVMEVVLR